MSRVPTSAVSGSGSTQELRYTIHVVTAKLIEVFKKKSVLYVEIKLPNGLQVFTHTVESSKLEWNRKFDFISQRTVPVRFKLNKREPFRSDICLAEASISVGELNDRCQGGQDYSLVLISQRSRQSIGTIFLQLQVKAQEVRISPDLTGSRRMVENMRSKIVETLSVAYPDKSHTPSSFVNAVSATGGCEEPDGFEILNHVRNQLDSMKSGKLKTALGVIDAAAKIHPCVESSWRIVSSLHRAYQKKADMDSGVIRVFASMDHVLSFVEDVDKLKDREQRFFNLVEESLRLIKDCGTFIFRYLNGNTRDRAQLAFSSAERLSYYRNQLGGLAENLGRIVNVHIARRVEDNHSEVMEALEKINRKLPSSGLSSTGTFPLIASNTKSPTLGGMHRSASTSRDHGRSENAQEPSAVVSEANKRVLSHDQTLALTDNMHELASTYRDQGRLDNAQELFVEVIEIRKRILGKDHSSTLFSMHNLALVYRDQGRLGDAQELLLEVIEAEERVFGNDHPSILLSRYELAFTYRYQGRLDGTQELLAHVVEANKRVFGNENPLTLKSMHELASTYRDQGRLGDAQELFIEVIAARKRVLGKDHSLTLLSMHYLALTYRDQGRLVDAQELLVEVIEAEKRVSGDDHPSVLLSRFELAFTYRNQGRPDDAQELFADVVEANKRVLGINHSLTLRSMFELASMYRDLGRLDDAQALFAEVIETRKRVLGADHYPALLGPC